MTLNLALSAEQVLGEWSGAFPVFEVISNVGKTAFPFFEVSSDVGKVAFPVFEIFVLGLHADQVKTTMIYTHVLNRGGRGIQSTRTCCDGEAPRPIGDSLSRPDHSPGTA